MILLDTCTLLWLSEDPVALSREVIDYIEDTPPEQRFVSAISALEIGILCKIERIELPTPPQEWFTRTIDLRSLNTISIDWDVALSSTLLPDFHKDPADRIIVATAQHLDATIITPDKLVEQYDVKLFWK